jgi:Fe-S-cluster-containing dehydrogenase component
MKLTRRGILQFLATRLAPAAVATGVAKASMPIDKPKDTEQKVGLLYDTTICTGCKACVSACTQVNGLTPDTSLSGGIWQMPLDLNAHTKNIIKLYKDPEKNQFSFVKYQCMHCIDPACASGCPFNALEKTEWGAVTWNSYKCIGCRYCEVSCPFLIPKFEWDKFNPKIVKCELCSHLLKDGRQPGCTQACPTGAVVFGTRDALLKEAKFRITNKPGKYFENRVYGETEGGGTQVLYLSHIDFEKIGLPKLGDKSIPSYATKGHHLVYKFMWAPIALYAFFANAVQKNWKHHQHEMEEYKKETGLEPQL